MEAHLAAFALLLTTGALGIDIHVVLGRTDLDLRLLGLGDLGFGLHFLIFLLLLILKLAVIGDLAYGRLRIGGDFDQIETGLFGFCERFSYWNDAVILG